MRYSTAKWMAGAFAALALCQPGSALAQSLTEMSVDQLRGEVRTRYDAALAMSVDPTVVSANSNIHTWASEAKVQCGIALGFLKSNTRDQDSLRRCEFAYNQMVRTPPPPPPLVPPPPPTDNCPPEVASTFFFDWDSTVAPSEAPQSVAFMAENQARCGWSAFTVVGHTDRSGSDSYNEGLAMRRARVIADMMIAAGIPAGAISVSGMGERQPRIQTMDGERTPENRRVEVEVNGTGER